MAAGLDGIKNEIDPGEPCIGINVYEMPYEERRRRGMTLLPQTLLEALSALEEDEVIQSALGPIADEFIKLKKSEWSEFMTRQVTPWEIHRYLTLH
jgi:glutamine synthetase